MADPDQTTAEQCPQCPQCGRNDVENCRASQCAFDGLFQKFIDEAQQACAHGFRSPVVCPVCEPEVYERARPQVMRRLQQQAEAGRPMWSK